MYRELVKHEYFLNMTYSNYKKIIKNAKVLRKSKINFCDYEFCRSSYNFYFSKIHNIIGDGQKNAISYYNLVQDKILQKHSLILNKPQEKREFLNRLNDKRDWSSHFNISDARAKMNYLNIINNNRVDIAIPEYVDIFLAIDLLEDIKNFLNFIDIVKQHIGHDFYVMFNQEIEQHLYIKGTTTISDLKTSITSFEYSKDKKKNRW